MTTTIGSVMSLARNAITRLRLVRVRKAGRHVHLDPGVLLSYPGRIHLGHGARIARNVALRANSALEPGIAVGDQCMIQDGALLNASEGFVHVGDRSWIGPFCVIYGNGGVRIGRDVMVAAHSCITSVGHRHDLLHIPMMAQGIEVGPVTIADDVWIGMNCTILPGVTIGRGAIVAAGAVVRNDVAPFTIVGGVPAREIGRRQPHMAKSA
jgi:acetyltransferase-like isoleucine patch superfamily enzyme